MPFESTNLMIIKEGGELIIRYVLNNNLISTIGKDGQEIIVKGEGVGFQKKKGDVVDTRKIEKIFTFIDSTNEKRFRKTIESIPSEFIDLADRIIQFAKDKYNIHMTDILYLSLSDHLENTVIRYKEGIQISNALLWDIKRIYKNEFEIGLYAIELIKNEMNIDLKVDEAGYIAMYFINAQLEKIHVEASSVLKIISDIGDIVKIHFKMHVDEEEFHYQRFITHLKFFSQRMFSKKTPNSEENELFDIVKEKYPESYKCVNKIFIHLAEQYRYELSKEEMLYLMLHIEKLYKLN